MDIDTQSTDVDNGSPIVTAEESTSAAPSSVSESGDAASPSIAGDVITGTDAQAIVDEEAGTVDPDQDDPLKDVPSLEELEQNKSQQYAQALINLRTAYEARKTREAELTGQLESTQPLIEQHGGVEAITSRLGMFDQLFSPVINPETQEPEIDPSTGLPAYDPTPFFQSVDEENPGFAVKALNSILQLQRESQYTGQSEPMWKDMFRASGLDPDRLGDYQNIDALTQPSTDITPEELNEIDPKFHEAYKSFNPDQRDDLRKASPLARESYLQDRAEKLERQKAEAQQLEAQKAQEAQQAAQIREYVSTEQSKYLAQVRQEGYAELIDGLAKQVTFSADEGENADALDDIGAFISTLIDPDLRFAADKKLARHGLKLEPSFDEALQAATKHSNDYKAYELAGMKMQAANSLAQARAAKAQVNAKLSTIALKLAQARGATVQAKANQTGKLLTEASRVRPTPGSGAGTQAQGGILPAGMRADSPEADIYLWRQQQARVG